MEFEIFVSDIFIFFEDIVAAMIPLRIPGMAVR
jgi:hypothetical protein